MIQLLTCKELASALRRNVSYVYAMRRRGFEMPGKVATLSDALVFLKSCPNPRSDVPAAKSGRKRKRAE